MFNLNLPCEVKMKFLVILTVFVVGAYGAPGNSLEDLTEKLEVMSKCLYEYKDWLEGDQEDSDNCFNACSLKNVDVMNFDGSLNVKNILSNKKISKVVVEKVISDCDEELAAENSLDDEFPYPCLYAKCLKKHEFFKRLVKTASSFSI